MVKHRYKLKMMEKNILFVLFLFLFLFMTETVIYAAGDGCCNSDCKSGGGSCPCPRGKICWYEDDNVYEDFVQGRDYCGGHNFTVKGVEVPLTPLTNSLVEKCKNEYNVNLKTPYYVGWTTVSNTEAGIVQKQTSIQVNFIECTICHHTAYMIKRKTDEKTELNEPAEPESTKTTIKVYYQNTDGSWPSSANYTDVSTYIDYPPTIPGIGPNGKPTMVPNPAYPDIPKPMTWSYSGDGEYYPSDTHTGNSKSDASVHILNNAGGTHKRYLYRKQYYFMLHPNTQNSSTPLDYQYPDEWERIGDSYRKKYYVGQTADLPSMNHSWLMTGYTAEGWYESSSGGSNRGHEPQVWKSSIYGYNDPNTLWVYDLYTHWCSEPGRMYLMPNSQLVGTDSCYAGYVNSNKNTYLYSDKTGPPEYSSNQTKLAFDTAITLPNVSVTNVTMNFTTPGGSTVDYPSKTTNIAFTGWTEYQDYSSGYYYYMSGATNSLNALTNTIGCGQCSSLSYHGTLSSPNYHFNHGNWGKNSADAKGKARNSLSVASFDGSWDLILPNAYKTGYIFTGWYNGSQYIGMAGDTIDLSDWTRTHNTGGNNGLVDTSSASNGNLQTINLVPHFEPLKYKILYVMNVPTDADSATESEGLQSHSPITNPKMLSNIHSLKNGGSAGTKVQTFGSPDINKSNYSYIGNKTYTYDSSDWTLENMPITVNDYYFTGWTYTDIAWTGYGGMRENGVTLGSTRIGNGISDTYDMTKDYSLKTLTMKSNVVQNIKNNLPDTTSSKGEYTNFYTVNGRALPKPQSDGTNPLAGNKVSGLNNTNPTVYIVLTANWTDDVMNPKLTYDSNNNDDMTYTNSNAFRKLTQYIDLLNIHDTNLSNPAFGSKKNVAAISSADTATGSTDDDGSYDKNATSDTFVLNKNTDKYYDGISNGRKGFFSFQGWSTWKYATWRDSIDSNKKDTDNSELQVASGHDANSVNTTFKANALTVRKYNDVSRSKRVGDLFYRMAGVFYPEIGYNTPYQNTNAKGNMLAPNGSGDNYNVSKSSKYWNSYKWRWIQGTTGHYTIPIKNVFDQGISLYAIWDAYPTSQITNTYCYIDDIEKLTPAYLFSKVIATDYEDLWNQKNYSIGGTSDKTVDWNTVAKASANMNNGSGSSCPSGDYTYTYSLSGTPAYMNSKFTATLTNYNFNRFKNASFVDDIASVSVTYRFVDSAGNTTYKTAWVYILDKDDTENNDPDDPNNPDDPDDPNNPDDDDVNLDDSDNVRYSYTRFISDDYYNKAKFDSNGNYVLGSAKESEGSLLLRSKWYMNTGYRSQLQSAFANLEEIGNSKLELDLHNMVAIWSGDYHPKFNYDTLVWEYDFEKIKQKTKGVYVLEYEDILKTKEFVRNHDFDTGNYTGETVKKYIDSILKDTAVKRITD